MHCRFVVESPPVLVGYPDYDTDRSVVVDEQMLVDGVERQTLRMEGRMKGVTPSPKHFVAEAR
jgi:hypothetical protein